MVRRYLGSGGDFMEHNRDEIVLQPGEGSTVSPPGHPVITTKVSGGNSGQAYSMLEMTVRDEGPPLHKHLCEEESFYVLEGEITLKVGRQEIRAVSGSVVLVPRGTPHTFWNAGTSPARMLVIFSPAGYEAFFVEVAGLTEIVGSAEYTAKVDAIREKYNAELVP